MTKSKENVIMQAFGPLYNVAITSKMFILKWQSHYNYFNQVDF